MLAAEAGVYQDIAWSCRDGLRHSRRRTDNGATFREVTEMAVAYPISRQWKGYWQ
jgi:hypothetical protein